MLTDVTHSAFRSKSIMFIWLIFRKFDPIWCRMKIWNGWAMSFLITIKTFVQSWHNRLYHILIFHLCFFFFSFCGLSQFLYSELNKMFLQIYQIVAHIVCFMRLYLMYNFPLGGQRTSKISIISKITNTYHLTVLLIENYLYLQLWQEPNYLL